MSKSLNLNARDLAKELDWLTKVLDYSLNSYANQEVSYARLSDIKPPYLTRSKSGYAQTLKQYKVSFSERLLLILALAPYIKPQVLDVLLTKDSTTNLRPSAFGGIFSPDQSHFIPTGETALFILSGNDLKSRFELMEEWAESRLWNDNQVLDFQNKEETIPKLKRPLIIAEQYIPLFTFNNLQKQPSEINFPAQNIETNLEWKDLILSPDTLSQIREIEEWVKHQQVMMEDWKFKEKIKPGYRTLFHGASGTGKTLAAKLLGKSFGQDVYRVAISRIVSKYIGETEKNLSKIIDKAEANHWILFFDEADALFGKRTTVSNANDRYANQEVSYLLQRIEDFNGLVILAMQQKKNMDDTFLRRFNSIIHFPMPSEQERLQLWKKGFSPKSQLAPDVDLTMLAQKFELSGGAIYNVISYASLKAMGRGDNTIIQNDLMEGIKRELKK